MFTHIIQHIASCWCIVFIKIFCLQPINQRFAATCQGGSSNAALKLHLSHPVFGCTHLREIVFHLQSIWDWENQPDVQSCLLKESLCLGFGSWTDSQPCGMAAVEGLFKLHPG